ncbi:flagellar export chaperone FliS [Nocardioides daejeonensis]|uniref:flagellar export chaperone FliS n=1 Tax=Nocardioides daejeonensis TaxID=1046556 RepID=UPI000D750219|nr:flagellar export chaperone FliS [Nocardioides daejeonensis]
MYQDPRKAYLTSSVSTAGPATLLVMLCDRLVLDVERALLAQEEGRFTDAHAPLVHAQDIVSELSSSLRVDLWEGATQLRALYTHLHGQLVLSNVRRDLDATRHCLALATDIADTWREAAAAAAAVAS